ncbi:YncE family protein [Actinomadura yumaensis]|uniref:YncE family protein n=1 Tax=Actinomadura yumaensis TaxID=111807 RepID=UPI0036145C45
MSFGNIFDSGGQGADSAKKSADALKEGTPGADQKAPGAKDVPKNVRDMERERDPWLVRQTAHGALDVIGFLGPLLQKFSDVSAAQKEVSQNPQSTSDMASSARDKALEKVQVKISDEDLPSMGDEEQKRLKEAYERSKGSLVIADELGQAEGLAVDPSRNRAYVADRTGKRLWEVDLASGAKRVVAGALGLTPNDVALDGTGTAVYVADWDGDKLLKVPLPHGDPTAVAVVDGQYGVAMDGPRKAYVADGWGDHLYEIDLPEQPPQPPPPECGSLKTRWSTPLGWRWTGTTRRTSASTTARTCTRSP